MTRSDEMLAHELPKILADMIGLHSDLRDLGARLASAKNTLLELRSNLSHQRASRLRLAERADRIDARIIRIEEVLDADEQGRRPG